MIRPTRRQVQTALAFYSGQEPPTKPERKKNSRPEAAALTEVTKALRHHRDVAWIERQNSGAHSEGDRFIRYGWPGCSDLIGQMKDGKFLAVEVKAPAGRLSEAQRIFLDRVQQSGGVAFVARSAVDVFKVLGDG